VGPRQTIELPIQGMDCADCARRVEDTIAGISGVRSVNVLLAAEKAIVELDPTRADPALIRAAVESIGYRVPVAIAPASRTLPFRDFAGSVFTILGIAFGAILLVAVAGEGLGLLDLATDRVPGPIWLVAILLGGFPIFREVIVAALRRQVISHTLMTVGVLAAIAVGQWATAIVVVFFMRLGDYVERFTTERGRQALRGLTELAPRTARLLRDGVEIERPVDEVHVGDIVIVRPGEQIPVDGQVVSGQATVDQAAVTGESMPIDVGPGARVFAASLVRLGSLQVRVSGVGPDTTFGRVIRLVEEAEANRARVQRLADRFSRAYLPIVSVVAVLTWLLRHDPLATAAVLVVACSCSFALATPIAILASIGASARHGLLIKGGRALEALARGQVLLIDKTGTLTVGRPRVTDLLPRNGGSTDELLSLAASAERYSEHPLAEALRQAAREQGLPLLDASDFEVIPGLGVRASVAGHTVVVGSRRLVSSGAEDCQLDALERQGKTTLVVSRDGTVVGIVGVADTLRPEVPVACEELRRLGVRQIEILTGDNDRVAATIAGQLGVGWRANLLPEDKIAVVRDYQKRGQVVIVVGDGINDAPALAQADVGIAMGEAGTAVACEAAQIVLMRDDWTLVPSAIRIARRTMTVIKLNLAFTIAYNLVGLTLAASGVLPPVLAAAAQSLPDLGILGNSARLLHQAAPRSIDTPRRIDGGVTGGT